MTDHIASDQGAPDGPGVPSDQRRGAAVSASPASGAPDAPDGPGAPTDPTDALPRDATIGESSVPRPPTPPARRTPAAARSHAVQYRGDDLDAARGPGLGCFWAQVIVLAVLVVLTPVTVSLGWPFEVSAFLLFATLGLLLLTGQTIIFLLRLVAAERRGRRRPLASGTRTVGELEDTGPGMADPTPTTGDPTRTADPTTTADPTRTADARPTMDRPTFGAPGTDTPAEAPEGGRGPSGDVRQ